MKKILCSWNQSLSIKDAKETGGARCCVRGHDSNNSSRPMPFFGPRGKIGKRFLKAWGPGNAGKGEDRRTSVGLKKISCKTEGTVGRGRDGSVKSHRREG